jgi:hypothetical protein
MWMPRPIYELLPYVYMGLGAVLIGTAWFLQVDTWPGIMLGVGSLSLLVGIVLFLRRKDYRTRQAEYSNRSLDD